jgi:hypothetical protein
VQISAERKRSSIIMTNSSSISQSDSFELIDGSSEEIAAFSALVQSSSLTSDDDEDGDAASLVSMDDERLRQLLVSHDNDNDDDDDDDDGTIASLEHHNINSTKEDGEWRHIPSDDDDNINDNDGDGTSIAEMDDDDENDTEDVSLLLLSPTRVRQHAQSLLHSNNANENDIDIILSTTIASRLHSILHILQNNPYFYRSTAAVLFMGTVYYIWTNASSSFSNNRFTVSSIRGSDYCNNNMRHGSYYYPPFPADVLLGISISSEEENNNQSANSLTIEPPYTVSDFLDAPPAKTKRSSLIYWEEIASAIEQTQQNLLDLLGDTDGIDRSKDLWANLTTWGPCYPRAIPRHQRNHHHHNDNNEHDHNHYLRINRKNKLAHNWTYIVQSFNSCNKSSYDENVIYPTERISNQCTKMKDAGEPLGGLCRPSFLIIGQGKCGTSSLYHYLIGHPRILPAKEKQIDYFNYHKSMPLSWYYTHFPSIESFLGTGSLMTGEASPGYMPYPSVIEELVNRLSSSSWIDSASADESNVSGVIGVERWKAHVRSLPKIIAIVRNPIERAKSSYKYNYVEPAIEKLRSGSGITVRGKRIPGKKSDQYYRTHHLFSFEELAYAELGVLKECLKSGGSGELRTYTEFARQSGTLFYESVRRRNSNSTSTTSDSPPLIYLDDACYDATKSKSVPRSQWKELATDHPNKTLALPNLHLIQSIIGRGVYALPLEWWYEVFSHVDDVDKELEQIHVVCTEDLADAPGRTMEDVTNFLGLPEFDFTNVTNVGRYNVGGHRGYDTITKIDLEDDEHRVAEMPKDDAAMPKSSSGAAIDEEEVNEEEDPLLFISDAFRNELIHFYQPYNERLFRLIGRRCPW